MSPSMNNWPPAPAADAAATVVALPNLNERAPAFEGRSTQGLTRLADFRGKWLVFFAHPADFTPVCASELVAFARRAPEFALINCALLGLSVDSVFSHLAWRESIREKFGVVIDYPILEDVTLEISRRYGMLQTSHGHTSTVRALFIIDDQGVLRAAMLYPVTTGRSVGEVLRLVQALQASDRHHALTPEGWKPGDRLVEPPPDTADAAAAGSSAAYCVDWYYRSRPATST
jgi:peroxiredoxin 2/4